MASSEEAQQDDDALAAQQEERRIRITKLKADCKADAIAKLSQDKGDDYTPPDEMVTMTADLIFSQRVLQSQLDFF